MTANLISQFDANSITEQIEQPVRYREAFRNLLTLEMLKSYSAWSRNRNNSRTTRITKYTS